MFTILKGGRIFSPVDLGIKDLVMTPNLITTIAKDIIPIATYGDVEIIDVSGKYVVPGFIDQHVHLIGGGGEGGFATRTPEVQLTSVTLSGITTVVGCLGTDGTTRHMESLLAKARGLEIEGISTYVYTGAYEVPTCTITGSVRKDMILIDKVIGCGEIAISDHRSAEPLKEEIAKLAAEARVGGILSGKAGVFHLHVGSGKRKLSMVLDLLNETDLPITTFTPTHLNRNSALLEDAVKFAQLGGYIDFTAGEASVSERSGVEPVEAIKYCLSKGVNIERITMSSDGNGSMPNFNEEGQYIGLRVAQLKSLQEQFKYIVRKSGLNLAQALQVITANPAKSLKLYPKKGAILPGSDADIVVLDDDLKVDYVFAKGRCVVRAGIPVVKGTFEN